MMLPKTIILLFITFISSDIFAYDTLKVTAELDTSLHQIVGVTEHRFHDADEFSTYEFQLYPNVYSSAESPYLKGEPGLLHRLQNSSKWGSMQVDSILVDGKNHTESLAIEFTRGVLNLDKRNLPDMPIIDIFFTTTLPESGDRLSYFNNNYLLDGWFPFPAVLREKNIWYNPQYGHLAELVGDYFIYDIKFGAPSGLVVAGSAAPKQDDNETAETGYYHSIFGPAHDFALALDPDYIIDESTVGNKGIKIYYRDYEFSIIPKIRSAISKTIEFMTNYVGPYEYDRLSCVFSDIGFSGGIEFPGLIALSSPRGTPLISNANELLTIHEVVHQWFYGMIGSDQIENPWMDESITDFFTQRILANYWGEEANLLDFAGLKISGRDFNRISAHIFQDIAAISQPTYSFVQDDEYFGIVYYRGALAFETLDNLMGDSLSMEFWQEYFETYKFKHPTPIDFRNLLVKKCGQDLANLFDILIDNTEIIDLSVTELYNEQVDSAGVEVKFILQRQGKFDQAIKYRIYLANGDSLDYLWKPKYNRERIVQRTDAAALSVVIDPDNNYSIDANLLNNSAVINPDNRPGFRLSSGIMFLIESILSYMGGI